MSFADVWKGSRRLFLLRLLVEVGGNANEGVLASASAKGGFKSATRDDIRGDLDLLKSRGCLTDDWLNDSLRVVTLTERGEDAAFGRIEVDGVEHSIWRR